MAPREVTGTDAEAELDAHPMHAEDVAVVNDPSKSSEPPRKRQKRKQPPEQPPELPRKWGFHVVQGKDTVKATNGETRSCLPDAATHCALRLQVKNWDHATVVEQVMPRDGKDPTINDLKASQMVKNNLHFDFLRRSAQHDAKGKAHRIFHLASAGAIFLVQAAIKMTDDARKHGMTIKKAHHCFAVTGHGPRATTSCAIIDNRAIMPKATLLASDLASPEKAKSALDRFFGGADAVVQCAHIVTPAGTGNSTSAPAAKCHRHT